jgi:hypothetical protein
MYEFNTPDLIGSLILTWIIGLTPPLVFRYLIIRKPLSKRWAILVCGLFVIVNLAIFISLGSKSKSHAAVFFIAMVSYWILHRKPHSTPSMTANPERRPPALSKKKPLKEPINQKLMSGSVDPVDSGLDPSKMAGFPMPEEPKGIDCDGWAEEFKILYEYDATVKKVHDELGEIEKNLAEKFRIQVVTDRKKATAIRDRLIAERERELKPYAADSLNDALAKMRKLGSDAEKEFTRVIEVMGEDVDTDSITAKIGEKYAAKE